MSLANDLSQAIETLSPPQRERLAGFGKAINAPELDASSLAGRAVSLQPWQQRELLMRARELRAPVSAPARPPKVESAALSKLQSQYAPPQPVEPTEADLSTAREAIAAALSGLSLSHLTAVLWLAQFLRDGAKRGAAMGTRDSLSRELAIKLVAALGDR